MKLIKKLISVIVIAIFSILGCSGHMAQHYYTRQPPGTSNYEIFVKVDKEFSDVDKLSIDKAISQWNYVLNSHYTLKVVDWNFDATALKDGKFLPRNAYYIVSINNKQFEDVKKELSFNPEDKNKFILAFAILGGTIVYINKDRVGADDVYPITMHEMAHIFGAKHDGFRLMNNYYSKEKFQCVDWKTAEQVANFLHLHINDLNWCFYIDDFEEVGVDVETLPPAMTQWEIK